MSKDSTEDGQGPRDFAKKSRVRQAENEQAEGKSRERHKRANGCLSIQGFKMLK